MVTFHRLLLLQLVDCDEPTGLVVVAVVDEQVADDADDADVEADVVADDVVVEDGVEEVTAVAAAAAVAEGLEGGAVFEVALRWTTMTMIALMIVAFAVGGEFDDVDDGGGGVGDGDDWLSRLMIVLP